MRVTKANGEIKLSWTQPDPMDVLINNYRSFRPVFLDTMKVIGYERFLDGKLLL